MGIRTPGFTRTTTRAPSIHQVAANSVFEVTGRNPKLEIALELERIALEDEYFVKRKLYPNVDFYSGIIYQAMGFNRRSSRCCSPIRALRAGWPHVAGAAGRPRAKDRAPAPDLYGHILRMSSPSRAGRSGSRRHDGDVGRRKRLPTMTKCDRRFGLSARVLPTPPVSWSISAAMAWRIVNVLPLPTSLRTVMEPPCVVTIP